MEESKDKWIMFKNFMHNELGVDKETIREWIKEACREEAIKIINNTFEKVSMKDLIIKALTDRMLDNDILYGVSEYKSLRSDIVNSVAQKILNDYKGSK